MMMQLRTMAFGLWLLSVTAEGASSKIPDKNPFLDSELSSLSTSLKKDSVVKLYFSGNITGMTESCGCALNPKGGFERRYNFLKQEGLLGPKGQESAIVLDFGNMLFKSAVTPSEEKTALKNAEKMVGGTNFFPYAAVNFGSLDRAVDPEKMKSLWAMSKFAWLSSNILPSARFAGRIQRRVPLTVKGSKFVIFGLSSLDDKLASQGWKFEKPMDVLTAELKDLAADVFPIVLSDLEVAELMPLAASVKRPVLFLGSRETGGWERPIEVGQALLVHLRQQGQDWGVFSFSPQLGKSGWFNPSDAQTLAQRWDDLASEVVTMRSLASSDQRNAELLLLEQKMMEVAKLAPTPNDIGYSSESIEMDATFDGANPVTKFQ